MFFTVVLYGSLTSYEWFLILVINCVAVQYFIAFFSVAIALKAAHHIALKQDKGFNVALSQISDLQSSKPD